MPFSRAVLPTLVVATLAWAGPPASPPVEPAPAERIRGTLTLSKVTRSGGGETSDLEHFLASRKGALKSCYERELQRNPALAGDLALAFTVTPTGKTADLEATSATLESEAVRSCFRTVARAWVLTPKPAADTRVTATFHLEPVKK